MKTSVALVKSSRSLELFNDWGGRGYNDSVPYMVGKLAPDATHFTRGLVKYIPGRGYFRAVHPKTGINLLHVRPSPIVERVALNGLDFVKIM